MVGVQFLALHLLKQWLIEGWDSLTVDMQHGLVDYSNALPMMQTISTTDVTPLARVNWNEPGQIMKIFRRWMLWNYMPNGE